MKQRTRQMHGSDELIPYMADGKKDDDYNDIQLHRMKSQDHFIEAQVQEGDTLQALSLRFYCSVSELKRINHIHKDNEIFARRTIKVPVTPYSVLTERLPSAVPIEPAPSTSTQISTNYSIQELLPNNQPKDQLPQSSIPINDKSKANSDYAIDCNAVVMNSTLVPSLVPYTDEVMESVSEDTQLLPNKPKLSVEAVVVKELTSHGADFGLKWFHLVCCMLVLGVVIPIIYVLFYLQKPEHEHEHENST